MSRCSGDAEIARPGIARLDNARPSSTSGFQSLRCSVCYVDIVRAAPRLASRPVSRRPGYQSTDITAQQQQLRRSTSTPAVHTLTRLEELERLQTRAEKTRHDLLPPQLGARLAAELRTTSAAGGSTVAGRMFARRRDRAERSVVPERPAAVTARRRVRPATPPEPVVHAPPPAPQRGTT